MAQTDFSPNLGLPYLLSNQAQKHVTINESLRALDGIVQLSVLDRDLVSPPVSPNDGDRFIIASGALGEWGGHDGDMAAFVDGGWLFFSPRIGWQAYVEDEAVFVCFQNGSWQNVQPDELQNLQLLGIDASADAQNPLIARLNAALFTAKDVASGGNGDIFFKLNKETASDTLSILLQNGFSSRAEIGLIGDEDLVFKVSPDGAVFFEGLRIDKDNGEVSFPSGVVGIREQLTANRTYFIRTDGNDANDGLSDSAGGAFLTYERAVDAALSIEHGSYQVTLEFGVGTFPITSTEIKASSDFIINIRGQGIDQTVLDGKVHAEGGVYVFVRDLHVTGSGEDASLRADQGASLDIRGVVRVSSGTLAHVFAGTNSLISLTNGRISVNAGGNVLLSAFSGGYIRCWPNEKIIVETPISFSNAVVRCVDHGLVTWQSTIVNETNGTISGRRYSVTTNGVLQTYGGGATAIPGSTAGSVQSGGVYA